MHRGLIIVASAYRHRSAALRGHRALEPVVVHREQRIRVAQSGLESCRLVG